MVQKTFQEIRKNPTLDDYVLLAQGVTAGSPRRLLKQFSRFQKVMLFGANVFWDGLDFTDAHLDALIVVRLPFMPPITRFIAEKPHGSRTWVKTPFTIIPYR